MTPYEQAFEMWHRDGPPDLLWSDLLSRFIRSGVVISTPSTFLLARKADAADFDSHVSPLHFPTAGDCWNVWLAIGDLAELRRLWERHPLPWVSYYRRGAGPLKVRMASQIFRHALAESTQAATAGTPARPARRT